jgi:dihydroflavonol-4-reductase
MKILVTGANGHLGYNLVKELIKREHDVRASVRSLEDESKVARVKALGDVMVVEAELNHPDQLRQAMEDIDLLFHTAAVYAYVAPGLENEIVDASVKGIDNAFHAASKAGVKKIVLTSSVVSLPLTLPGDPPSDENDWATDLHVPYIRAKTHGEQLAWKLAEKLGLNLVTVLPGAIAGPGFVKNTPTIDLIEAMMMNYFRFSVAGMNYPFVDIRDVVDVHIRAAEADCEGRFIVCNDVLPMFRDMVEAMHYIDSKVAIPLMDMPGFMMGISGMFDKLNHRMLGTPLIVLPEVMAMMKDNIWNVSSQRSKDVLGWQQQISLEQSLKDTMQTIKELKSVAGKQSG